MRIKKKNRDLLEKWHEEEEINKGSPRPGGNFVKRTAKFLF
jgi:hypothetical protein